MKEVWGDVLGSMQERMQKFADLCTTNGYPCKLVKVGTTKFEIVPITPPEKPTPAPKKTTTKKVAASTEKVAKVVKAVKTAASTDTTVPAIKRKPGRPKKNTTESTEQ